VTYVSNIYKYYIAYTLVQGEYLNRLETKKTLTRPPVPGKPGTSSRNGSTTSRH
jgi:hypothetical protein